ncbi:SNF2-related protein [Helicobacter sp. 14348-15]|uniref:SNF2-related protein n=1 Tax=Helicobacter colisuis TaxID=2949739 RepID=UPI00202B1C9E|nr:SNF2-related protein [Helicobacter colisuis]MCL9821887.1 SNF2-related protein [Helicobacter colisuis]
MKTLLILSNSTNASNIGIIQNITQDNPIFFQALDLYINDKNNIAFKSYVLSLMQTNEYFTEFGEKPDFNNIINDNQVEAIFTYFEDIQRISFAIKQSNVFLNYDLKDFLKTKSFESLQSLFQEKVNANIDTTNQESSRANVAGSKGGFQSERHFESGKNNRTAQSDNGQGISNFNKDPRESILFGERGGSKGDNPIQNNNGQGISSETMGISQSTSRIERTLFERGESERLQAKNEQRERELWNGGKQGSISANTESSDSISEKSNQESKQHLSLSTSQSNNFNERRIAFRERIRAILESKKVRISTKQLLSKIKDQSNTLQEQDSGIREDKNRDNRESQEGEFGRDDRGSEKLESSGDNNRGFRETIGANNGLFESRISVSKKESPSPAGFSEISDIIPSSARDKQGNSSVLEQLSNTNDTKSENNRLDSATSDTETQGEQSAPNQANISQEELSGNIIREYNMESQNGSEESGGDRLIEDNTQGTQEQQGIATDEHRSLFETNPDISTRADETRSNKLEDENPKNIEPIFETFNDFNLLKQLEGEEYKGEIDFNLSKKERIEANFNALTLVREIFERKKKIDNIRFYDNTDEKLNAMQLEIIKNNYFSDDIPMTKSEQETLAKYTGFGGLSDFFFDETFSNKREELKGLIGEDLYKELMQSSYNAYYTPSEIIESMYLGLETLGILRNEKVIALEPSCGIGHFITKAPANFEFEAVEKDTISATIAKLLHPQTKIHNKSFEEVLFDREFDVVIGNPPYENIKAENSKELIHNYFVSKSQNLLKDGGISSFVITSGFLDSKTNTHRLTLMQDNVFLSATRLPNSSFKQTHTDVLSDIIFLRRTKDKEAFLSNKNDFISESLKQYIQRVESKFLNSLEIPKIINQEEKILKINSLFVQQNGEVFVNTFGETKLGTNQFGEATLKVTQKEDTNLKGYLKDTLRWIILQRNDNKGIYNLTPAIKGDNIFIDELPFNLKDYSYFLQLKTGSLFFFDNVFYTKESNTSCREAYFRDEIDKESKYLIDSDRILEEKRGKIIFKNPIRKEEEVILKKLIEFRDLLNYNLRLEKVLPNNEESNQTILAQKERLRALRKEILILSNAQGFNQRLQKSRKENNIITRHTLKRMIELEKLESFKIFATENVVKIPKKDKFETIYQEADILQKRVLYPLEKTEAKDSKEALQKTFNETGRIDLKALQSYLPNIPINEILKELIDKELIFPHFEQPTEFCLKDKFLEGDIKGKAKFLERLIADNAGQSDTESKEVWNLFDKERLFNLLKQNFPKDIAYNDIEINFGANFIPLAIYKDFIRESFFNNPDEIVVEISNVYSYYTIENFKKTNGLEIQDNDLNDLGQSLQVQRLDDKMFFSLSEILETTINNKSLEVYHIEKTADDRNIKVVEQAPTSKALRNASRIRDLFAEFLFKKQEYREVIEKIYNNTINVFSNNRLEFEDMLETPLLNQDITLRTHQKNAVFKGIMSNSLLLDHEVGAGKTLAGIAIVMEQIRMNCIKKALVLVPNHLSTSWGAEFIRAYPSAKILVGDKINSKKDRKEFLYRARNGDFDAIIMKHSTFENLNVMESFQREILSNQIENLRLQLDREKVAKTKKEEKRKSQYIEKRIRALEAKLEKQAVGKTYDEEIAFEDLGIDCLVVDEAHYFKNLFITTTQENIRGIPTQESKKAMKMFCATQYIHNNQGFKLYFLTGTPISNSIAEFYTMQRYLQPQVLEKMHLENFDDWQKAFTKIQLSEELDSSGINYALVSRLSSLINAPELMSIYKQNADIISTEDIEKISGKLVPKVKNGSAINIIAPRSEAIANFIGVEDEFGNYNEGSIIDRMNHLQDDPKRNNMLVCTSEARKAALDFRLIDPLANDYEQSKINQCIDKVLEHYNDGRYEKNTQLIFCDLGVSKLKSQKIDVSKNESQEINLEDIAKERGLEYFTEYDNEGVEIRSYYREFAKDDEGKFLYDEYTDEFGKKHREKIVEKVYEIEELINQTSKFDVYSDILKKLVAKGIPQKEIAFIGDAKSDKEKESLFQKVKAGIVRVLIGSTSKLGTGTNVQERIVAMHELDCPWKPSELAQRAGRGIRQGNIFFARDPENFEIGHYRYATEQTYDARMFQINEQKLKPLSQMKKAETLEQTRVFSAIDEEMANIAEMKAIATGNPFILEKYKIENLLKSEEEYKRYYEISIINAEKAIKQETPKAQELKGEVEALREMFNNKNFLKENYEVEVLGIKTTRKLKAMQSEKDFNAISEKIQSKIIQMLRQPDEFFTLESKERIRESNGRKNNAGEIEFLSVNEIKLNFLVSVSGDDIHFKGVIITKDNHRFYPKNLNLESHRSLLVTDPFKVSSILTKLKNTFDKVSSLLENKVEELKKYENIIEAKNRYLENNTIDNYDRKPLIAMLKQDLLNMNDIFRIRQEKRKEGIKIEMDSQEIADLIPQYPKYLDEKGKLQVNAIAERKDESPLPVESLPKESKESKTDLEKEITEPKNTHLEQTAPQQEIQNMPTKKEDLQEKRKDLESKDENVAKISQNESIDIQEIAKNKIEIKDFKDKDNINNRMRILEQNMTSIQKKQHSKRMMGER